MPAQYQALWTTAGGGKGYSTFHMLTATSVADAQSFADAVRAFFNSNAALFPDEVTIDFATEVTVLALDGTLVGVYGVTKPAVVNGTSTAPYNRAAGARIDWVTGEIVSGRRLTGRTYLVPAGSTAFDAAGLLTSASISAITATGTTLITALSTNGTMCVWSKTHGVQKEVLSASVPGKGAILRGRRD